MDGIVTIALAGLVESEVPASPFWMSEKVSRPSAHQQAEASGKRRPGSVEQGEPRKTANTRSIDQREGLVFPGAQPLTIEHGHTGQTRKKENDEKRRTTMRDWNKIKYQTQMQRYGCESINGGIPADIALPSKPWRKPASTKEQLRNMATQAWAEWNATRRSS
jgi:hypothetical protein